MNRTWAFRVLLGLTAVLLTVAPNIPTLGTHLIGIEGDNRTHLWGQWWVTQRIFGDGQWPLTASRIWFPDGGGFFSLDTGAVLLTAPLRVFLDDAIVFNLHIIIQLVLAFVAATALADHLGVRGPAASVAGLVFSLNAWVLAFPVGSGVSEALFLWPFPVITLGLLRTLRGTCRRGPFMLVFGMLMLAVGSPIFAIMAALGCIGAALVWGAIQLRTGRENLRNGALRVAIAGGSFGLLAAPVLFGVTNTTTGSAPIYPRESGVFSALNPLHIPETSVLAVEDLLRPGVLGLQQTAEDFDRLMFSGYIGYGVLILVGLGFARGSKLTRACTAAAAPWLLLALGAQIFFDHAMSGPALANPLFLGLFHGLPFFHATMHSVDRFMAPAMLCLGLAAASGLQLVIQKHSLTKQRLAVIAAAMVLLSELLGVAPPPWPMPSTPVGPHPASLALAEEPQQGAVIDLPFRQNGFFVSDIYVQQMTHGRPVPYRNIGRHGEPIHPVVWDTALFQRAVGPLMSGPKPRPSRCEGHRELSAAGFAFIVVRRDRLTQSTAQAVEQPLAECLGAPDVYADAAVYRLDPSAASDPALANPRGWRAPPRHGVGGVGHR